MVENETSSFDTMKDTASDLHERAAGSSKTVGDRAHAIASNVGDAVGRTVDDNAAPLRDTAASIADSLKTQASAHVDEAKGVISAMADEARARIGEIIDQQKSLGADKLTGLSRAAQNAASDLDAQNPHVARIVRDAAGSVDRIAGDLRDQTLSDVVASVSSFARKQPVAFFAGSVLAGFVLARFLKSEPSRADGPHNSSGRT